MVSAASRFASGRGDELFDDPTLHGSPDETLASVRDAILRDTMKRYEKETTCL